MGKWEYRAESAEPSLNWQGDDEVIAFDEKTTLKSLGREGWELCGIYEGDAVYFFFKKEKKNEGLGSK